MSTETPASYYASLPAKRMATGILIRSQTGKVLVVKTTYKDHWEVVGGVVDRDESPKAACRRETREELGLDIPPGRLLNVDYSPRASDKTEVLHFLYDGGIMEEAQLGSILLQASELAEYRFADRNEAITLLGPRVGRRVAAALDVLADGADTYTEEGGRSSAETGHSAH
jgi:8-oxo-dGTP diphosphatase